MRRAKVDTTHAEIRETLRKCGWDVVNTHQVKGFIDIVAFHPARREIALIEAKTGKGKLTDAQKFLVTIGWPIRFVRSAEEAAKL